MTPEDEPTPSALRVVPPSPETGGGRRPAVVPRKVLTVDDYVRGVAGCDRTILGRTFSLMESALPAHQQTASSVLARLSILGGGAIRLGITGVPGVGKSTLIEALGLHLVESGLRVAVLSIDPSSSVSGGSILADKTRMERLSMHANAFVRPSACGSWRGGVARGTRESILVCEAAGFDVVIVETVGVGQSETVVASMVDFFLLLMLAGAGDELQGMKRGIMEMADAVVITKSDGGNVNAAAMARSQYELALRLLRSPSFGWSPPVQVASAMTGDGVVEIWNTVMKHRRQMEEGGLVEKRRQEQNAFWMKQSIEQLLIEGIYRDEKVKEQWKEMEEAVRNGLVSPFVAAERLVSLFVNSTQSKGSVS